jgi:single-strand DNA-binding protein
MASSVNLAILLGRVGKDPMVGQTNGGKVVANFTVATSKKRPEGKSGNLVEYTEWHNIVAYGRLAEVVRDYVKKGSQIHIIGENTTRSWDDKETGKKVYKHEVLVNNENFEADLEDVPF